MATLTLAAPQRHNALTPEMSRELVGALVIHGSGGSFCAGAHTTTLGDAGSDPAEESTYASLSANYAAFTWIGSVRAVTVAAVRGPAVGAGLNLALATNLRIVTRTARLMSGFQRIGLHPGGGHFVLLSRFAGRGAAAAMALCGAEDQWRPCGAIGPCVGVGCRRGRRRPCVRTCPRSGERPFAGPPHGTHLPARDGPPALGWDVAVQTERAPQMWSMRRR